MVLPRFGTLRNGKMFWVQNGGKPKRGGIAFSLLRYEHKNTVVLAICLPQEPSSGRLRLKVLISDGRSSRCDQGRRARRSTFKRSKFYIETYGIDVTSSKGQMCMLRDLDTLPACCPSCDNRLPSPSTSLRAGIHACAIQIPIDRFWAVWPHIIPLWNSNSNHKT